MSGPFVSVRVTVSFDLAVPAPLERMVANPLRAAEVGGKLAAERWPGYTSANHCYFWEPTPDTEADPRKRGAVVVGPGIHSIEMDEGSFSVEQVRRALLAYKG